VIRHASTHMQTQLRTEFIVAVVDDETAQRLEESELPITVVRCSSGRSSALNAGAALARGEVTHQAPHTIARLPSILVSSAQVLVLTRRGSHLKVFAL
jgi:hypothetical protein